ARLEAVRADRLLALGLATVGAVLVVGPLGPVGDPLGVLFGLLAAALLAGYVLIAPRMLRGVPALTATAFISSAAALGYLLYASALGWPAADLPPPGWVVMAALGGAAVGAAVLFLAGLARAGSARGAIVATV